MYVVLRHDLLGPHRFRKPLSHRSARLEDPKAWQDVRGGH